MRKIQMNDKIRQLAEQASHQSPDGYPVTIPYSKDFAEKFAELIIRECVQVCADRGAHHDGLYSAWADDCSKRIGKHFGVEE